MVARGGPEKGNREMAITANIVEQGNGFPSVGDYVVGEGQLYRVLSTGSRIHTDGRRGNYVTARVEEADWSDCPEGDEHSAMVEIDAVTQ